MAETRARHPLPVQVRRLREQGPVALAAGRYHQGVEAKRTLVLRAAPGWQGALAEKQNHRI